MLEELKTFITVTELQSFTRAAEQLNISQPTVSLHIKRLEEYFDEILIYRSRQQKKPVITAAGRRLYKQAKKMLSLWKSTYNYVKDDFTHGGSLTIGVTFTIGEYFLPEFLGEFNKEFPDIKVELEIGNTQKIGELLNNYKIDAAIVEGNIIGEKFVKRHLYEDKLVIVAPIGKENGSLENERWIIRENGSGTRSQWEQLIGSGLTELKFKPLVMNSNFAVKEAVRNNLGVALLSEYIAEEAAKNKEVAIRRNDIQGKRYFDLVMIKDSAEDNLIDIFSKNISDFFRRKQEMAR